MRAQEEIKREENAGGFFNYLWMLNEKSASNVRELALLLHYARKRLTY